MKKFKFMSKAVVGMMAIAMTAGSFSGLASMQPVGVYANDEVEDSSTTEKYDKPAINYWSMTATITAKNDDPYVFLEVYKDPTKPEKVANTYTYPVGEDGTVEVDLGFYKATKDFGIRVYGSSDMTEAGKSDMLTVKKQADKVSFKVDTSKDTFAEAITNAKEGSAALTLTAGENGNMHLYQYRSLYAAEWSSLEDFDYATAKIAGTTIVVRKAAADDRAADTDAGTAAVVGAPASPEVKVKIAASAKAPKVTIDYVNGTISVTDKMEIAVLGEKALADADYKTASKKMTVAAIVDAFKDAEVPADANAGFTLAIRTKADKKAASMPCFIEIKAAPKMEAGDTQDTATVKIGEATTTVKVEKTDNGLKATITGSAKLQYEKTSNKWVDLSSGTEIKDVTSLKVRVAPVKADKNDPDSGSFASTNTVELKPVEDKDSGSDEEEQA